MYKLNLILSIIIIQYLIVLIFLIINNYNLGEKIITSQHKLYRPINDIYSCLSMYSLFFKYYDEFINNSFKNNSSQLIKLNDFMKDSTDNYFAIGDKVVVYFYKKNNKYYINISPLFIDELKKNYNQMLKYSNNCNLVKILTMHKFNTKLNIYKYSNNKFKLLGKKNNLEETFDFMYNIFYKNVDNLKLNLIGYCLGGNILYLLAKYIKSNYNNINYKLITLETYFYDKPNLNNHINLYTYNSIMYWIIKRKQYRIDYVYKLKNNDIINNLFKSNFLIPLVEYNNLAHFKYYVLNRKN